MANEPVTEFDFEDIKREAEAEGLNVVVPPSDVPGNDYAEFTIRTIKKVVKREDVLVRQTFYTGFKHVHV